MNDLEFDKKTGQAVSKPKQPSPTSPLDAILWVVFIILLAISPAVVWAAWRVLL